jgi:hypothetical protein
MESDGLRESEPVTEREKQKDEMNTDLEVGQRVRCRPEIIFETLCMYFNTHVWY